MLRLVQTCKKIAEASLFQNFITVVILAAAVLVGIETYPHARLHYHGVLDVLDKVILGIFILEIVVKMVGEGKKPWRFFNDGWNVFDFVIVAGAFMPFMAQYATVLRLLRLLRVLKLVRALPRLQLLVGALLKSIPSMGYVSILLLLLFYVYAVAACFMWGQNDPVHFGTLQISFLSLFRVVTLEDWTDVMYIQMFGCDNYGYDGMAELCVAPEASPIGGALFFVSFVLIGTMVMLNLFVGIILSGMDEAQQEQKEERELEDVLAGNIATQELHSELAALTTAIEGVRQRLATVQRVTSAHADARTVRVPRIDAPKHLVPEPAE